jgi:hypothetical protein
VRLFFSSSDNPNASGRKASTTASRKGGRDVGASPHPPALRLRIEAGPVLREHSSRKDGLQGPHHQKPVAKATSGICGFLLILLLCLQILRKRKCPFNLLLFPCFNNVNIQVKMVIFNA